MLPGELAEQDLLAIRIVEADSWRITAIVDASSAIEMAAAEQHLSPEMVTEPLTPDASV